MSQPELLTHVVSALDEAEIEYMITGSIVSSLQGEPRLTHDLDVVLTIDTERLPSILAAFPEPRFYVDEVAAKLAIQTGGMFNVIDTVGGDKVDFWLLGDVPFDRSRFRRRYKERLFGTDVVVSSPEDTILSKLWWARLSGGSEKYFQDALRVFEVQAAILDHAYLGEWAESLEVAELMQRIRDEALLEDR